MLSRTTSVMWVVRTEGGSTTVHPRAIASSRRPGSTHNAGRPNVGSMVRSPGKGGRPPFGSITSNWVGRSSPRPASISLMRIE